MLHLLCIMAMCASPTSSVETIISASESVTIDYWEFTPFPKVAYWKIDFNKSDLEAVAPLLRKAKPESPRPAVYGMSRYEGVLRTRHGDYSMVIGEDTRGGKSGEKVLILLRPLKNGIPDLDQQLRFLLEGKESVQFVERFYPELTKRAKGRNPFKVTDK
jgi:hypothetical protein